MDMIKCNKCNKILPTTEYYKGRKTCKKCHSKRMKDYRNKTDYNKKYYEENKEKDKIRCLENYYKNKDNPEKKLKWRENQLKVKYNITLQDWNDMYESQGFKCAICETEEPMGNGLFHVDHCHSTGKIRGLLCHHCNSALGQFRDSIKILEKAIKYLEKFDI